MRLFLSYFIILLLGACAAPSYVSNTSPISIPESVSVIIPETAADITPTPNYNGMMNDVAIYALSQADTPYHYGGNSLKEGFDCSGFVQYVFLNTLGIKLPRTSIQMSQVGEHADQLQPGDLVFFNTKQLPFSHVGIYVGEERFVHAPSTGKAIMVTSLNDKYWRSRYNGARRINLPN